MIERAGIQTNLQAWKSTRLEKTLRRTHTHRNNSSLRRLEDGPSSFCTFYTIRSRQALSYNEKTSRVSYVPPVLSLPPRRGKAGHRGTGPMGWSLSCQQAMGGGPWAHRLLTLTFSKGTAASHQPEGQEEEPELDRPQPTRNLSTTIMVPASTPRLQPVRRVPGLWAASSSGSRKREATKLETAFTTNKS